MRHSILGQHIPIDVRYSIGVDVNEILPSTIGVSVYLTERDTEIPLFNLAVSRNLYIKLYGTVPQCVLDHLTNHSYTISEYSTCTVARPSK